MRAFLVIPIVALLPSCRLLGFALPCAEDGDCAPNYQCRAGQPIRLEEGGSIAVRFSGLVVQGFDDLI